MKINVELDELKSCQNCGIVIELKNKFVLKAEGEDRFEEPYTETYWICPVCKTRNGIDSEGWHD